MRDRSRSSSNYSEKSQKSSGSSFAPPSKRLYIAGITSEIDETDLRSMFEKIGKVTDFFVKMNEGKGFGFAQYSSQEEADEAIKNLNGKKLSGKMIWVKYALEKSKGERKGNNGNFQNQKEGYKPRQNQQPRQFKPYNNNRNGDRNQGKPYQKGDGNTSGKGNFYNKGGQNGYKGGQRGFKGGQNGFKGKFNGDGENRYAGKNDNKFQSDNKPSYNQPKEQSKPEQYDY